MKAKIKYVKTVGAEEGDGSRSLTAAEGIDGVYFVGITLIYTCDSD